MTLTKIKSPLCDMLGITYPIIQAGMGPFNTSKLATAVSDAGGIGTVSVKYLMDPVEATRTIVEHLHYVKDHTNKNFAVNTPIASEKTSPKEVLDNEDAIIKAVLEAKQKDPELKKRLVLYITSGGDPTRHHKMIKDAGLFHFHLAGSAKHAKRVEELGLDGVIASGYEMGGHTHLAGKAIHTFVLVPSVVQTVKIPVIACGGVCDAETFAAALAMGAAGVQMGTRFITTNECDFHENYKKYIVDAGEYSDIVIQSVISPARCLKSAGAYKAIELQEVKAKGEMTEQEKSQILEELLRRAEEEGDTENALVAAGQASSRINSIQTVKEVIESMVDGAGKIIKELQQKIA